MVLLFDFKLIHVLGEKYTGVDGLSRRPQVLEDEDIPDDRKEWMEGGGMLAHTCMVCWVPDMMWGRVVFGGWDIK